MYFELFDLKHLMYVRKGEDRRLDKDVYLMIIMG